MRPALALFLRHLSVVAAACALVFAAAGYFGPRIVDDAIRKGILQNIVWRPDSPPEVDARFRGQPTDPDGVPDFFRVWLWNLTNLPEVRQGAKPKMIEVGPLTYVKSRVRLDPRWDRRGRVAVKEWDYHVFRPELSAAAPEDVIVTLNLPLVGVLEVLHSYNTSAPAVRMLLDLLLGVLSKWRDEHVDGLFTKRTAGELIWGYEDLLLQRLSLLLGPALVPTSRVQLLRNDTEEEVREHKGMNLIDTGWRPAGRRSATETAAAEGVAADLYGSVHGGRGTRAAGAPSRRAGGGLRLRRASEYDEQLIWNMEMDSGWSAVTSWGPSCSEPVRGTDAFQFRPGLDRDSVLRVWIAELFRSAELLHVADEELHGIRLLRFVPEPREAEPDLCHHQFIRGLANVTVPMAVGPNGDFTAPSAHGVPILMSLPHYCMVDDSVAAAVEGISCDPPRHGIFLDVEPTSGITMRAAKRLQLSSQLTASARATLEPTLTRDLILPVFWAEEASEISAVQAAAFRGSVYHAQRIAAALRVVPYPAAGAALALAAMAALAAVAATRRMVVRQGSGERGGDADGGDGGAAGVGALAANGGGGGGPADIVNGGGSVPAHPLAQPAAASLAPAPAPAPPPASTLEAAAAAPAPTGSGTSGPAAGTAGGGVS